ncbi:AAEL004826-PA [Aedes aegypti]|uniref:AAEL004826-PA n=1 Tax=Aedes aegypti TaxID=7159 RepID=Q0IFI8_AEDAE|nr:AAEL004826-PA [Aedes aegypti]
MARTSYVIPVVVLCAFLLQLHGVPLPGGGEGGNGIHPLNYLFRPEEGDYWSGSNETLDNNSTNGTHKDLYVIKAVVYEIGILVDAPDNDTEGIGEDPITEQQVDLTFFSHDANKTHINLGDIPVPVATSVNGQVLTGIAPVHLGAVSDLHELVQTLPISGTIVNITQTNSSYVTLTQKDIEEIESGSAEAVDVPELTKLPIPASGHPLIPNALDNVVTNLAASGKN